MNSPAWKVVKVEERAVRVRLSMRNSGEVWGPAVPVEMLRDEALAAWQAQHGKVLHEAQRLIGLMLTGVKIGARGRRGAV